MAVLHCRNQARFARSILICYGYTCSPVYLSIILIAFVGQVWAAASISSKVASTSETTFALGFILLFFSTTNTFGASVSQLPKAIQSEGSTIRWNRPFGISSRPEINVELVLNSANWTYLF